MVYVTNVIATEYIDFCNEYIPFLMNAKSITLREVRMWATFWTTIGLRKELFYVFKITKGYCTTDIS